LFPCLWRMTNEHSHRALGKGQKKAGKHRPDAWASGGGGRISLFGRPGFDRKLCLRDVLCEFLE
jgi:hypothetical protein